MRTGQRHWAVRVVAMAIVVSVAGIELLGAPARAQQVNQHLKLAAPKPVSELKPGLTQCLTPEQWKQVDAKCALQAAEKGSQRPTVRALSSKEMDSLKRLHNR